MIHAKRLAAFVMLPSAVLASGCEQRASQAPEPANLPAFYAHIAEALPPEIEKRHLELEAALAEAAAAEAAGDDGFGTSASVIIKDYRRWAPGSTVTVAFPASTSVSPAELQVWAEIERLAKEWTGANAADLILQFRNPDGSFRTWSTTDSAHAADIRITFAGRGYWSGIGRFSSEPRVFRANEPSMSLAGFVTNRPPNWQRVVRHEFGHALGFMHEHQNANIDCRFRYQDDPGYVPTLSPRRAYIPDTSGRRPGLIRWFSGYPNFWDEAKVRANLGPIGTTSIYTPDDFVHTAYDPRSIMKYFFEPEFFQNGRQSPCYGDEATALSADDRSTAKSAYEGAIERRLASFELVRRAPALPADVKRGAADEIALTKSLGAAGD